MEMGQQGQEEEDVVIVGAGIAGLATAVALKRVGITSLVLEKLIGRAESHWCCLGPLPKCLECSSCPRCCSQAHFYLSPYHQGIHNKCCGWIYSRSPSHRNSRDRRVPQEQGQNHECKLGGWGTFIGSCLQRNMALIGTSRVALPSAGIGPRIVHRKALMEALLEELSVDTIRYSSKLTSIEAQQQKGSSIAIIRMEDGTSIKAKVLIGCDGVHSGVARWLGLGAPVHSGRSAVRGLAVYPEGHGLKQEVHQFVDAGRRGGFAPLSDTDIYWFLVMNSTSKDQDLVGNPELMQSEVLENFAADFPPTYLDVVRHSVMSTLTWAPLMFRLPWDVVLGCACKGSITVAGDAMHPMTPDLGQGGCTALEDGVVIGRHIGESFIRNGGIVMPPEVTKAIESYVQERRWHVARVITGSYLSGWVQQGGSGWWRKFFRDVVFYGFLFRWIFGNIRYDCGKLPTISSSDQLENHPKSY